MATARILPNHHGKTKENISCSCHYLHQISSETKHVILLWPTNRHSNCSRIAPRFWPEILHQITTSSQKIKKYNQRCKIPSQTHFAPYSQPAWAELYHKSDWGPPICIDKDIKKCMTVFESTLRKEQLRYNEPTLSNLIPKQWKMANYLNSNNTFITIEADKKPQRLHTLARYLQIERMLRTS